VKFEENKNLREGGRERERERERESILWILTLTGIILVFNVLLSFIGLGY
jgi:hypothetical protein